MGFECPNYSEGKCDRQNTGCTPTKGNCVLKGKFKTFEQETELSSDANESAETIDDSQVKRENNSQLKTKPDVM
jgi:hypothetical protein